MDHWIPGRGFRIRCYCNYLAPDSHRQRDSGFLELNFGFRKPLILDSTSKNLPVRIAVHRAICLFNNLKSCSTSAAGTRASLSFFSFKVDPSSYWLCSQKDLLCDNIALLIFFVGRILRHGFLARNSILPLTSALLRSHKFPLRWQFHNTV